MGFPHSSVGKSSACNAGDPGSIPGLGRSPGEENGSPLQYSCLENPWWATVLGVAKDPTEGLSTGFRKFAERQDTNLQRSSFALYQEGQRLLKRQL